MSVRCKRVWMKTALCLALGLLWVSCAPAAAPAPAATAAITSTAGVPKPAATTPNPAAPSPTAKPAGEEPRYGGVLTVLTDGDPPSFDAVQEVSYLAFHPLGPATSTLLQFDPLDGNKVIPDLAERWEASADGLTYAFYLRKGAKFHNGMPATAEDARYSLDRVREPPKGVFSPRQLNLEPVKSIEATDETTLKVALKRVYPSLVPFLAQGWMVVYPKKVVEEKGDMKKDVIGTGPFKYKEYKRGVSHDLVKFDDYFIKGRPYLDGVKFFIVKEAATRFAALRARQALAILPHPGIALSEMAVLKREDTGIEASSGLYPIADVMTMNTRRKPWSDARVRKAMLLGMDQEAAIQFVRKGSALMGGVMAPTGQWDIPKDELLNMPGFRKPKDADMAEAKRLLAAAGVAPGAKVGILARSTYADLAVFIQDYLNKMGFDASADVQESAVVFSRRQKADFDIIAGSYGVALDDPDALFTQYYISDAPGNDAGLKDPKVDELFRRQSQTLDAVERKKLVIEMQKAYLDNPGAVPTDWQVLNMALRKEIRGYKFPSHTFKNTKFQDVWLAK